MQIALWRYDAFSCTYENGAFRSRASSPVLYQNQIIGAVYAYEQLNIFMFDENTALGDYIKSGKITSSDIAKMMLVCHNTVLSAVLTLIAQGLQREDGQDWLDQLEQMDPAD